VGGYGDAKRIFGRNLNPPMPHSRRGEYGVLKKISGSITGVLTP
jgi:hypothetical protein